MTGNHFSGRGKKLALPEETGPAGILPASSGYPLLGCASAEPDSVSPD